jgi:lipid A 3-O-deacylase
MGFLICLDCWTMIGKYTESLMQIHSKRTLISRLGTALALLYIAPFAHAQAEGTQGGVSVNYGIGNHYRRTTLNYETPAGWSYQLGGSGGRIDLTGELGLSYWQANGSRSPGELWQLSAIPMFRWWGASVSILRLALARLY